MLTCVCRPVSSSFADRQSIMGAPIDRDQVVVTSEPKTKVGATKPIVKHNTQVQSVAWLFNFLSVDVSLFFIFLFLILIWRYFQTYIDCNSSMSILKIWKALKTNQHLNVLSNRQNFPQPSCAMCSSSDKIKKQKASGLNFTCGWLDSTRLTLTNNSRLWEKIFLTRNLSSLCGSVHVTC